jgi:uncharacterized protein (TIGR04562 family)
VVSIDKEELDLSRRDSFAWDTISVILEGTSPLELPAMAVANRDEAFEFLRHYGFDLEVFDDRQEAEAIHDDAIRFMRKYLLTGPGAYGRLEPPRAVTEPDSLADLLVLASSPERTDEARWACAVLRVMHTIHHANRAFHNENLDEIRKQVLQPFRQCLQVDELGCPVLQRAASRVQLEGVFFKEDKSRDSIIMKLLHKPNNVAQDIYDWIGIQFVTRTPVDALLVVRFLRMHNLVTFANIVPGRSINNLIDLHAFRATYENLKASYEEHADVEELHLLERLSSETRDFAKLEATVHTNPFSGAEYRSIQFTCRQLIRIPHPARRPLESILRTLREHTNEEIVRPLLAKMQTIPIQKEIAFFFPYEIQILDYENYLKTRMGESSHAAYKKRQLQAARRRVLGGLIGS